MNGGLSRFCVEHGTGSTAVLIAWLRAGTGVDDGDSASLVDERNMSVTETYHVIGEGSEPCESGTARIDVFIVRFPRAGMDNQNFCAAKLKFTRRWSGGKKVQSFGRKGLAAF